MYQELTGAACSGLMTTLHQRGLHPTNEQLDALYEIPRTLTGMLEGRFDRYYFLSSLDPGLGKSTSLIEWLKHYAKDHKRYGDQGVIVCFDRYAEIERFVEEWEIPDYYFAVKVSGREPKGQRLNRLGRGSDFINDAVILLTTKEQVIMASSGGREFASLSQFFYQGKPRTVRASDETLVQGKGLTLEARKVQKLPDEISNCYPVLARKIEEIIMGFLSCKYRQPLYIPTFGPAETNALLSFKWSSTGNKKTAQTLCQLAGCMVTVLTDSRGYVGVDCAESLPEDFAPCLITDASGRVRYTYKLQERYRGNLIRLKEAPKDYSNLTVAVWRHASGKTAYEEHGNTVFANEIIKVINDRATEQFFALHQMDNPELVAEIKKGITNPERLKSAYWGIHTATNDFRDIPNIIITSLLTYKQAEYEALARASANFQTSKGNLSPEKLNGTKHGEYAHHLLQGVCRALPRKSEGAGCPKTKVWLVAPKGVLSDEAISNIFPGCKIEKWDTTPEALKGVRQKAFEYISTRIAGGLSVVPATDLRKSLGMTQSNFKRDIILNDNFKTALQLQHIRIEQHSNNRYFFNDTSYLQTLISDMTKSNQAPMNSLF